MPSRDDNVNLESDELGGQLRKSLVVALRPARLKGDVLSLHVAEVAHLLAERIPPNLAGGIGRGVVEQTDPVDLSPLRGLGGERRGEAAASHGPNERPAAHP